ncbi:MAG: cytochrome c [Anaerolineales bacterium]
MRVFLRRALIFSLGIFGLLTLALAGIYFSTRARQTKIYSIPAESVALPADSASLSEGHRIFGYRGCLACHGEHLEGKIYLSNPALGEVIASNLTRGAGGIGAAYRDEDWVRAIRHGIRPDGTPLLFMPVTEFYFLSDGDLGKIIAFIKSVPPLENHLPPSEISLTGRVVMTLVKEITFIPAELIPQNAPRPAAPQAEISPAYGEYLALSCKVCHGPTLSGGKIPAFPDDYPWPANLTTSAERPLPYWTFADFKQILRSGITLHARQIDPQYMPWTSYQYFSDDEIAAVWAYLQSAPPVPYGRR